MGLKIRVKAMIEDCAPCSSPCAFIGVRLAVIVLIAGITTPPTAETAIIAKAIQGWIAKAKPVIAMTWTPRPSIAARMAPRRLISQPDSTACDRAEPRPTAPRERPISHSDQP